MDEKQGTYAAGVHWREPDLAMLDAFQRDESTLPADAPRALISVRLSALTADTTSPVRQELELRSMARERGLRVVGVARDLNVSATRVAPWQRKELGRWLNDRVPDFDVILFWKMDRFVRRVTDLSAMIDWCSAHGKNLVSKHDVIDLSTPLGQATAKFVGTLAEIETGSTIARVTSLWDYAKTQSDWLVGKPPYGYVTDGGRKLVIEPQAQRVLRWCYDAAVRGVSARRMTIVLSRGGVPTGGGGQWTTSTLLRRLRNPALMGLRVVEANDGGVRRSRVVRDKDGVPVRVADPIFTEAEWQTLQTALDRRSKSQPHRSPRGATAFLGVLVCTDCGTNMTVKRTAVQGRTYAYLRCRNCPSGGLGAPDPDAVYRALRAQVMTALGAQPVRTREYVRGELGLRQAKPHWTIAASGESFGDRWEREGQEVMTDDLRRAGITCRVSRTKIPRTRAPEVELELSVPPDAEERLIIKQDAFADLVR
ncbi:recombinase family protein [Streptomyces venezuelae]|uniref:Recombinase family protein n=1 Tax=Streptomyces venezuelae TaxID=54571 RepID=A0A5P2D4V7_STRVZ|nr:recombinase family protein [Streptomyces venezuelae]QES50185.1 recombinase family protein [Streptomyces venezuelae]